jgi:hypothetical protein
LLAHKNEAYKAFVKQCRRIQHEKDYTINNVRSNRSREFDNQDFKLYYDENGDNQYVWAKTINTNCYVINRTIIRNTLDKKFYELWNNRKPNIRYFKVFGCKCFVLNDRDNLGKFNAKSDEGIFLGYSSNSKSI